MNSNDGWRLYSLISTIGAAAMFAVVMHRHMEKQPQEARRFILFSQVLGLVPMVMMLRGWNPGTGRFGGKSAKSHSRWYLLSALYHFTSGMRDVFMAFSRKNL